MLLIYVDKITPRNRYTFKTIFRTYLDFATFSLTADVGKFKNYQGEKFSYCSKVLDNELHFKSVGLLEQNGIKEQTMSVGEFENTVTLFSLKNE